MAGFDDLFKGGAAKGWAIGIGAALLAPVVFPVVASVAKPVARAMIKTGILMLEKGRETAAELGEMVDDLVAEAKSELEQTRHTHKHATAPEVEAPSTPPGESHTPPS